MEKDICPCSTLNWDCWIKVDHNAEPLIPPELWFSSECVECGKKNFAPHAELDEGTIPKDILERGRAWYESNQPLKEKV
ncbi:MAG: hypothetical protein QY316_06415 [Thermodesulfobacteriota bacterium]|nr:MAG: hypothetical protein QY316_06415 [Thermodesulfobacteriota bacterium]